ncbi:hypothetical protein [Leifsonia sp. TF02-11]|uniref:hypothetical protein n=1 Tax=Leifsonia sp. TF02-11 TaxID=2815212 RepID=UPI001AA169A6|nr:hypothetical protein [Leifsonia sp. TF02-11]MBO1740621.1 hypothetical protein [Leifsonia sp. TF02-11]
MNGTNRALNRTVLALTGLIVLGVSGLAILFLVAPAFASAWKTTSHGVLASLDELFGQRLWPSTTLNAAAVVALGAAIAFAALLLVFALRQGHGRTSTVLRATTDDGTVELDAAISAVLLEDLLSPAPGIASVDVSAYRVRRDPALKITVRCRRGASPRAVTDAVDEAVARLHAALGTPVPVFAELTGGFRARLRPAVRVDTTTSSIRSS